MATMMAMKVVDFASQSLMEKLERMLMEEAALLVGVEDDVRDIVAELRSINSLLMDMSTRRNLDERMQNWVHEMREVAYDVEDLIDEFECRLGSTPDDELGVKGFFIRICRCLKSLKARHDIASALKKLKVEVEKIRKRHKRNCHPNEATSSGNATRWDMADRYSDPRIFDHFVEEAQLVGIKQSKNTLIEWVMDENYPGLITISLVGFGGLGKTTLAKTIYQDPSTIRGHFQSRAWIAVSQNYNIKELLKKIIRQISINEQQIRDISGYQDESLKTEQLLNMMDEFLLGKIVNDHLQEKRYLIIFDDVWSTEVWQSLRNVLPSGKEGSRIIVTTRIEKVANTSCSRNRQFIFKVSPLSPELSWKLLCRRVFEAPDYKCPPELEKIGKKILQKCDGLPLAIVTIGGLLASKPDKNLEEWKDLCDHLGIFPEDYEICQKQLMRWWIAEGIVKGIGGFPIEKVAERCFKELVSRNLIQPSQFDESGIVKSCRVHDMMLDVIISISRKENFMVLLNEQPNIPPRRQKIRRLSWHRKSSGLMPTDIDLHHLRSFTVFGEDVPLKDYRKQRLLRAIDLEGCWKLNDLHPKSFSKLCLLKYLSLRNTRLHELPDSIGDLQNLEFLDIRGTDIEELPNIIVKLKKLVHLLAGRYGHKCSVKIYNSMLKVPKGIRRLRKLRKLGMLWVNNVQLLQEIGELVDLQKLAICFEIHGQDLASEMLEISALLSKLNSSLRSLIILHLANGDLKKTLDEVASPPLLLCKLKIDAELGGLPAWFASLNQVVEINLQRTGLHLQDLQVLRNLHTLVKLVLGYASFDNNGEDLVFDQVGFTHLKFLEIHTQSVSFEEGALQSLEILKMFYFTDAYSFNGIEHLHGLKEVHIQCWVEHIIKKFKNIAANHSNRPKCFATLVDSIYL
ncbi:disease resistance protein Pik-2-like [Curcuma longa]|uniref:disease resistance protein Pik-2-like n=1 Tax=Curcuma longa TaxID=136217 RepID=UPI003D9F3AA2